MFKKPETTINDGAQSAQEAFKRGDKIFQYQRTVKQSGDFRDGTTETLNSICAAGWELVNASFVSNVATNIVGYYVFKRKDEIWS